MPLQKTPIAINFANGVETKVDPHQVSLGKFLTLVNSVFTTQGRLTKRNGFPVITTLPNSDQTTLTTLNDNLIATGSNLFAFSQETNEWLDQGVVQPVDLATKALIRSSANQTDVDAAVTSDGLACVIYIESSTLYYTILDSNTGQQVVAPTILVDAVAAPRVFLLGRYFVITYIAEITAVTHLQFITLPISSPTTPSAPNDISSSLVDSDAGYDGFLANNSLYIAWADTGPSMNVTYISSTLITQAPAVFAGQYGTRVSVTADITTPTPQIYVSYWDTATSDGFTFIVDSSLATILPPTQIINNVEITNLTSTAANLMATILYENLNYYDDTGAYPTSSVQTDFVSKLTIEVDGTVDGPDVLLRSVGLASKSFIAENDNSYVLLVYGEENQPSYFLADTDGNVVMRLAYANGGGYLTTQVLPNISSNDGVYSTPYLIKDFLATVNKKTDLPSGTPTNAIYTQTGVNLAQFTINSSGQLSSSIANTLHLTGGQLWMYDSIKPVEHGFQVWPENIAVTTDTMGGDILAGTYNYVFTYEWTDNKGSLHRSAPSIPITQVTSGSTSENTLYVPTLRLTYKTGVNPVRIVGYRWSDAQQTYYQFTSITNPVINDTTVDYVVIVDDNADADILGQTLLYTTGSVIENIAAPASIASALFKNRLFLVDAEDQNLIWYSKQVIQNTPVEMSDLLTLYVAPTSGAQGSTGSISALSAMDDKLIIFKRDAIYYLTGTGPDNTGANNDFTDPIFITSSVGCSNSNSIVLMPAGIMFQSDKGIWLLGRDLSTQYIGSPVEFYNDLQVKSAQSIPATNQVRFIMDDNTTTLMYDYYYQQWGTFSNIRAISATLYQNSHTYLNNAGRVYQERLGTFIDGSQPVLMSFTTSWVNVAGVQGYERFYQMFLLGKYVTPFRLNVSLAYDYGSPEQSVLVTPDNFTQPWGGEAVWGAGEAWGGPGNVFEARVFPQKQKCESFQITVQEVYDASMGVSPGEGLSLSGLNLLVGVKKGSRVQRSSKSFG